MKKAETGISSRPSRTPDPFVIKQRSQAQIEQGSTAAAKGRIPEEKAALRKMEAIFTPQKHL